MKKTSFKKTLASTAITIISTLMTSGSVLAFDFKAGDVDVSISGFLNGYYTHVTCSGNQGIVGLAIAGKGLGCGNKDGATNIGNGLLPNAIVTSFGTKQNGLDIGGAFMVAAAISSADAISNNNNVDIRKSYFTIGTAEMGTVKIGRDYGLFGLDAILSDMTLLGVGSPVQATQRNRVSLGHIGAGTAYAGTYSQTLIKVLPSTVLLLMVVYLAQLIVMPTPTFPKISRKFNCMSIMPVLVSILGQASKPRNFIALLPRQTSP